MRWDEIDSVNEICALHNLASVHRAGHALVATYALEQHVIQQHFIQKNHCSNMLYSFVSFGMEDIYPAAAPTFH